MTKRIVHFQHTHPAWSQVPLLFRPVPTFTPSFQPLLKPSFVPLPPAFTTPQSGKRKSTTQLDESDQSTKRVKATTPTNISNEELDKQIQSMQLKQALYTVEAAKFVKVLTSIKLHENEGVIKHAKEIQYPHYIDGKVVKILLILFSWQNQWVWTVSNTKFTAPFCSMNTGNTNRKVEDLKDLEDKMTIKSQIVCGTHTRKQRSVVLTSLGVQKMCNRYNHYQPQYVAWIRSAILPLLMMHCE
jgi:hypothetical protein